MAKNSSPEPDERPRRRGKWRRRLAVFGLLLVAGAIWLNGPGIRWLGGIAARKALPKAGLHGDLTVTGTILGGLGLRDVSLRGDGPLLELEAKEIAVSYRVSEVIHGRLRSVRVKSLDAVVETSSGQSDDGDDDEPAEPFDPRKLADKLREGLAKAHQFVDPVDVDIRDVAFELRRDGETLVALEPTSITHRGESSPFEVQLGELTIPAGRTIPAQEFEIEWLPDLLRVASFSATPRWALRNVELSGGADAKRLLGTEVTFADRQFRLEVDDEVRTVSLVFSGEPLPWRALADEFRIESDFDGMLDELSLQVSGIGEQASDWRSDLVARLSDVSWQDWRAEDVTIRLEHRGSRADARWAIAALGGTASGTIRTSWPDAARLLEKPVPPEVEGTIEVGSLQQILAGVRDRIEIPLGTEPFPGRGLDGAWTLGFTDGRPERATAELKVAAGPGSGAPPLELAAGWAKDAGANAQFTTGDVGLTATIDGGMNRYRGELELGENSIDSLRPWISAFVDGLPEGILAAASWRGEGTLEPPSHSGRLDLARLRWQPPDQPPVEASAELGYQLPELAVDLSELRASREELAIECRGKLADQRIELAELAATDNGNPLLGGSASIPLAEEPADWRAMLRLDDPWRLQLATEELDFGRINELLPKGAGLPVAGTARLALNVAGTPAAPEIDGDLQADSVRQLDSDQQIPPCDLTLRLETREGRLALDGKLQPEELPEITLSGSAPLDHAKWIDDPESALEADIRAEAVVPPVDLAGLIPLPESVERLAGTAEARVAVTGTPNQPLFNGTAALRNLEFKAKDDRIMSVDRGSAELRLNGTTIALTSLAIDGDGGSLRGSGSVDLEQPKDPAFTLSLNGRALPAWRDDSTIVRLDTDLRLDGKLSDAAVSGSVDVIQSLFFRDFELIPIGRPFTTPSAPSLPRVDAPAAGTAGPKIPEPFNNWRVDVALRTRDPFLVRGNLAEGTIRADVRVTGTLGAPEPRGAVTIDKLDAPLPLSRLQIRDGKVNMRPEAPFAPELDIRGTSSLRPYQVNIFIHGTATNPKITFTSNPPLPENEILTLLATGSTSSQLEKKDAATAKLIQLLLEEARRGRLRYGKVLRPALELLDNVDLRIGEVDPYTGRDYNSATVRVTDNWLGSVAMDDEGRSRAVAIFVLRFK